MNKNLRDHFLSHANIQYLSTLLDIKYQDLFPILLQFFNSNSDKAKNCIIVMNHLFINAMKDSQYEIMGINMDKKIDKQDINYQTMMPYRPQKVVTTEPNVYPLKQMTASNQPQKIGIHQGRHLRFNQQNFSDLITRETEGLLRKDFTTRYYKQGHNDTDYSRIAYTEVENADPIYTYIDSRTLY